METIMTPDVTVNNLMWKIEHDPSRCTMCGSCVASCTFKAIKADIQRKSIIISECNSPC